MSRQTLSANLRQPSPLRSTCPALLSARERGDPLGLSLSKPCTYRPLLGPCSAGSRPDSAACSYRDERHTCSTQPTLGHLARRTVAGRWSSSRAHNWWSYSHRRRYPLFHDRGRATPSTQRRPGREGCSCLVYKPSWSVVGSSARLSNQSLSHSAVRMDTLRRQQEHLMKGPSCRENHEKVIFKKNHRMCW